MALAASGVLSTMTSRAVKTLGQCSAWQTWTGHSADETAATAHIAEFEKEWTEAEVDAGRDVRAMVKIQDAHPIRDTGVWASLAVYHFEAPVSAQYHDDPEQAFREFQNNLGATLDEMRADALADTTGLLLLLRPAEMTIDGPYMTPESEQDTDDQMIWADVRIPAGPKG